MNKRVNELIEQYLRNGGTLYGLARVLGINLSTLWRYRRKGFKDPFSVYLIATSAGLTLDEALSLAKDVCIANGGDPDAGVAPQRRSTISDSFREQLRGLIREELSSFSNRATDQAPAIA